jgi:hypothetical protein
MMIPPSQFNSGRLAVAVLAALTAAPVAFAADLPAPPTVYAKVPAPIATDWTGFYLGAGVGIRASQMDGDVSQASINSFGIFTNNGTCTPGAFFRRATANL